jgi:uncharacterized protein
MKTHVLRLEPGEDLVPAMQSYLRSHKIKAAILLQAIGSLSCLKIRFSKEKEYRLLNQAFEILFLQGTFGEEACHVHGAFADSTGKVIGGHIRSGNIVATTAEIIFMELTDWVFDRRFDEKTAAQELQARPK